MNIIIGIDPGSCVTGYGLIQHNKGNIQHIAHGTIKTKSAEPAQRLHEIFRGITEIITASSPCEAAIEQIFTCHNHQSALKLSQARGAALVALAQAGLSVAEYSAKQVKSSVVGYGGADKHQVQQMIRALLKLTQTPAPDAADALAIAICHCHHQSLQRKIADYDHAINRNSARKTTPLVSD